jgi:hypothetical protein
LRVEILRVRDYFRGSRFVAMALAVCQAFFVLCVAAPSRAIDGSVAGLASVVQESFPAPPSDRTLVYWRSEKDGGLTPLPFEAGTTPLRMDALASNDKMSRLELKGEHASTVIGIYEPHFFLFVQDSAGVHPPLLVHLKGKQGARRVSVMAQRGQRGFAIASAEIVKPHYRVLARDGNMMYMEVWGREPLQPGEYAFIGSDLARLATFGVRESQTV